MARRTPEPVQMYRGTTAQHSTYTGPVGEITVDVDKDTLVVHDGTTPGGHPLAKAATTITASNGVSVTSGGTLGANTAIAGVDATTSAKGVVQLSNATTGTSQTAAATEKAVADALQAAKDYTDSHGTTYTGTAPINVSGSTISVSDATTAAKGVVQVGTNIDVASGTISVKPWATYAANHSSVNVSSIQDGAIVQTDEALSPSTAVLAQVEQTLSGDASKVPSSYAVRPEVLAHAAMPSGKHIDLTLPASGGTVTAPADGWITFSKDATGGNQYLYLQNPGKTSAFTITPVTAGGLAVYVPVASGDVVVVTYTAAGTLQALRFNYADGSAPAA